MATEEELWEAVTAIRDVGNDQICLLKCTSAYPSLPENANLRTIPDLRNKFGVVSGLSDHTLGIGVAVASVALGASIIEKHFILSRADGGVDAAFSMEPSEMKDLVDQTRIAAKALGKTSYGIHDSERGSLRFRRSVFVVEDVKRNQPFSEQNLRIIRPGSGLAPKHYEAILGRKAKQDLPKGTPLSWDMVE